MARTRTSLLENLQGLIERTYDLDTGVTEIGRFVIGDEGFRRIYGADPRGVASAGSQGAGARTLVRQAGSGLAVSIYYPDHLVRCLERNDPMRRLDDDNVDAFCVLVEELDHFLVIAERYLSRGAMTLLDLELHANVTKYLTLKTFVARLRGVRRLSPADAAWVRFQVLEKGEYSDPDPEVRGRYRDAARLAGRYVRVLEGFDVPERIPELRRFHRLSPQAKIARINSLN